MLSFYMLVSGEWNMPFLISLIIIAFLYGGILKRFTKIKIHHRQPIIFFLGLAFVYVTMGSPLSTISHLSFSFHMIFMSIHYFIIPPFLLLGIPNHLFQQIQKYASVRKISRFLIPPKAALYAFAILFFMYHLQFVLDVFSQHPHIHTGYLSALLLLSFSMWWPIISPDPKHQFGKTGKKSYAFMSGLLLMPACSFFILNGLVGEMGNLPLHSQLSVTLCLPSNDYPADLLPYRIDQIAAGIVMLLLHKIGLMISIHHGNKIHEHSIFS